MKTADKEILLKDLCLRLPYKVICEGVWIDEYRAYINKEVGILEGVDGIFMDEGPYITINGMQCEFFTVKPYLRSMSSMTEEEEKEYYDFFNLDYGYMDAGKVFDVSDWMYSHHFDYRRLIEKGLALEAPAGMYNKEDKE